MAYTKLGKIADISGAHKSNFICQLPVLDESVCEWKDPTREKRGAELSIIAGAAQVFEDIYLQHEVNSLYKVSSRYSRYTS